MSGATITANQTAAGSRVEVVEDRNSWDAAVEQLGGHLLQTWRWGELKARHGWSPVRLRLRVDGEADAAIQLLFRKAGPLSIAYAPRGPFVRGNSTGSLAQLTVAIDRAAARRRAVAGLIEPESAKLALAAPNAGWSESETLIQPRRTIIVPVLGSDDEQLAIMKSKTRYNVRLAQRRGVTVREGAAADLETFYRLLQETATRDEFGIHEPSYFRDLLEIFGDDAALILAEFEGQLAAGAVVARAFDQAVYLFGASSTALQRHMGAYVVQFAALQWARERGCQSYDLWGIPPTDDGPAGEASEQNLNVRDGLWGVYRFKQGFGGDIVSYPGIFQRTYHPLLLATARRLGLGAS